VPGILLEAPGGERETTCQSRSSSGTHTAQRPANPAGRCVLDGPDGHACACDLSR
jgi:hypothetical protein